MFAQNIELAPSSRGIKISESSFKGFNSTFSFSNIESELIKTESGDFSVLKMDKTINGGELGGPALPIARELVAVPFGATPVVKVVNYTTTDYQLSDYGIERVYPQQPSYSKDTKVEDMVFQYNENAYQTRALNNAPEVSLNVMGTMRGVQLGALQVEPVSYNPANNTLRVYNDIELEVVFENADIAKTEETLLRTYSPYYDVVYKQLFNTRAIESVYDEHPDIFSAPVHMLVIANRMFEDAIEPWIEWKTQKGFYLKVKYTDEIGESANDITEYITGEYNSQEVPSFVIIVGDEDQVAPSRTSGVDSGRVTDLYYSSVDGDYYTDIYHSRMACETVSEMEALIHKILQYEQYTMPDPSYLDNVLLIAGADSYWNPVVGKPTIQYASNYYFNEEHGYENNRISFSATSEALGLYNRSFALVADGYLSTNIDDYGYDFYLGEEAVAEIRGYILAHKIEAPKDSIESIYGVVTEIGEDYLKIDDTILMKNPENGLTFTVYAHDNTTIKSYIMSGTLKIGDHIEILHRGISSEEPTMIRTAFSLNIGGFVFEEDESVEDNPSGPTPTPALHVHVLE